MCLKQFIDKFRNILDETGAGFTKTFDSIRQDDPNLMMRFFSKNEIILALLGIFKCRYANFHANKHHEHSSRGLQHAEEYFNGKIMNKSDQPSSLCRIVFYFDS